MLTIEKLFFGYNDVIMPSEIDKDKLFDITLSTEETKDNSLLFITEKVGDEDASFDITTIKSRPSAIVASKHLKISSYVCPVIRVGNVRAALSFALSNLYHIDYGKIKIIGVTGSSGKTTTATIIYKILKSCGYKVGFIGTGKIISDNTVLTQDNYSMTTPDPTLLYPSIAKMINDECKYIVMEVSSHAIALGKTAPLKFEYSIFTNLDNEHLDFHKSKEEYFKTKLKLFESSKTGLFNMDDEYSRLAYQLSSCEKRSFGVINVADAYATEIHTSMQENSFYYRESSLIFKANTHIGGVFNVYNTLAALKCVIDIGIKPCIAKRAITAIEKIDGRMELQNGSINVVIDYAHTPNSFLNCIKTLKQNINIKQKLILVFGCGGDRDVLKRPIFGHYAELYADKIIITEDNSRTESFYDIANDIMKGMTKKPDKIIEDRESAIRYALLSASEGDVVALIGKGHEKYKIIGSEYVPFDERKIVDSILSEMENDYENTP